MLRIAEWVVGGVVLFSLAAAVLLLSLRREEQDLRVVFLSVGEGDALLLTERGVQVLIDGGMDGRLLLERLGAHIPFYDRTIEMVIATHPDADHIGGFPDLFRRYRVPLVLTNGGEKESGVTAEFSHALLAEPSLAHHVVGRGSEMVFPSGARLVIQAPVTTAGTAGNSGSIVSELFVGNERFVFLADAPADVVEPVLASGPVAVLKVAHHGAKRETTPTLLAKLAPREAIISVGKNRYGHPAPEVLQFLEKQQALVFRTDERGDIVYRCREGGCRRE